MVNLDWVEFITEDNLTVNERKINKAVTAAGLIYQDDS